VPILREMRGTIHLWLTGAVLLALWLLAFLFAAAALGSCGSDCGDNGGRGAFIGLVGTAPLGSVGLTLCVLASGGARGPLRPLAWLAVGGGALIGLVAVVVGLAAVVQIVDLLTGGDPQARVYEREQMGTSAAAHATVAVVLAAIAASGLLPTLAQRPGDGSRRWARGVLIAVSLVYVAFALWAFAVSERDLPYALVGLFIVAGAAIALGDLRRRPVY
jgi:hypothetical protein